MRLLNNNWGQSKINRLHLSSPLPNCSPAFHFIPLFNFTLTPIISLNDMDVMNTDYAGASMQTNLGMGIL